MDREGPGYSAGIGAMVTLGLSFLPFSPLAGGVVAANGADGYRSGLKLGTVAGVLAAIPLATLFVPALAIAGWLGFGLPPSSPAYDLFLALVALFFLLYTVGLSVVGGVAGVWLRDRRGWDLDPSRWL